MRVKSDSMPPEGFSKLRPEFPRIEMLPGAAGPELSERGQRRRCWCCCRKVIDWKRIHRKDVGPNPFLSGPPLEFWAMSCEKFPRSRCPARTVGLFFHPFDRGEQGLGPERPRPRQAIRRRVSLALPQVLRDHGHDLCVEVFQNRVEAPTGMLTVSCPAVAEVEAEPDDDHICVPFQSSLQTACAAPSCLDALPGHQNKAVRGTSNYLKHLQDIFRGYL